jgi:hypothetical protein
MMRFLNPLSSCRVSLYSRHSLDFVMHLGCHVQCKYSVLLSDFLCLMKLSSLLAALLNSLLMVDFSYPCANSRLANCVAMFTKLPIAL